MNKEKIIAGWGDKVELKGNSKRLNDELWANVMSEIWHIQTDNNDLTIAERMTILQNLYESMDEEIWGALSVLETQQGDDEDE